MIRRRFGPRWAAMVWTLVLGMACAQNLFSEEQTASPDLSREKVLYTVGYVHLDTQWRWTYPQVIREFIPNTIQQNEPLFEKYPDYILNFGGAFRYQLMQEYHPEQFEKVRAWVAKGRWFPSGNSWDESDALIPSSESLIRQVLYGQRYFKAQFGTESLEFMLPDCFGFPASLPSVLAHCGLRGFSTQKLTWNSAVGIPFNIGVWEGLDGESVIAAFNPGDYNGSIKEVLSTSPAWLERINSNGVSAGVFADYIYHGVGDRGGAPRDASTRLMQESVNTEGPLKVISSRADEFFRHITDEQKEKMPRYRGDLLLTEHSAGSLTSQAYMKRWHRMGELLGNAAERASVAAKAVGAQEYPREKLRRAWELVLATEMHDILPGTSLPKAYEFSWNDAVLALNSFSEVLQGSVAAVARGLDTQVEGAPVVIFNPLAVQREDLVEAEVELDAPASEVQVFDPEGSPVPTQLLASNGSKARLLFPARVPSVGFAVYTVRSQPGNAVESSLSVSARTLENARYRIQVNDAGDIASIYDKNLSREMLSAPARLAFLHESPREWPAWNMDWKDRKNPPVGYVDGPAKIRVVENGPVRVALEITRTARNSDFVQTIRLAEGASGERIEVLNEIAWQTDGCSLKAEFPLSVSNPNATYNVDIGKVQRGNKVPKQYEVPSHGWLDLTDAKESAGFTVLTGAKYGSDKPADNVVRLTLLYSPTVTGNDFREQATQDWGRHEFIYGLAAHEGDWRNGQADWQSARMDQPMFVFQTTPHEGKLGRSWSFLRLNTDQVAVRAIKLAEDNEEVVVRLQELRGELAKELKLNLAARIRGAVEVDGLEKTLRPLKAAASGLSMEFKPFELRSIALDLKPLEAGLAPVRSTPVRLPFNLDVFSFNKNRKDGACDDTGVTIPAEMIGDTVISEGVEFTIGPRTDGELNAVSCQGQSIDLPEESDGIYILATAVHGDTEGEFVVDGRPVKLKIQDWGGYVGQWDRRVFEGAVKSLTYGVNNPVARINAAFIKRAPVAWYCSHRHNASGRDEDYIYIYAYKHRIDAKSARKLVLPNNPRIRVLAVSTVRGEVPLTACAPLYDDLTGRKPIELKPVDRGIAFDGNWPEGASPLEIGKRVAELFWSSPHANFGGTKPPKEIIYPESCAWYGALTFAQLSQDQELVRRLVERFEPLLGERKSMVPRSEHVDSAVFGIVPLEIARQTGDERSMSLGKAMADQQWEVPPDKNLSERTQANVRKGLSWHTRFWIDDMYMIPALQAQAFRATKDSVYRDRAALQMAAYLDELQMTNGLFYHAPDVPFYWGRGNGWVAAGMTEMLSILEKDHPQRPRILAGYHAMMEALLKYQERDGMWRQLIDRPESWGETSCTAMFTYAMITGVKNGWLDRAKYGPAARAGWLALVDRLNEKAELRSICEGTNKKDSLQYYLDRGRRTGDLHGQAPLLWCASAWLR